MKPKGKEQEVIVFGSGLGGLLAGTILSKNKLPVLLLREKGFQSFYSNQGYHFVPFSNFSEKRLSTHILKVISQALNLPLWKGSKPEGKLTQVSSDKSKQRASFQVILPKARIDIFPQRTLNQKEWKREFPPETVQIESLYNDLDHLQHLLQKGREKKRGSPFFPFRKRSFTHTCFPFNSIPKEEMNQRLSLFSKEFRKYLQLQLTAWGNLYSDRFPLFLAAHIFLEEIQQWDTEIHLEKMEKELFSQFLQSGGRVEEIGRVERINRRWGKGLSLSLERDPRVFQSKFLIINSPLHRILSLLGPKGEKYSKWGKGIKPLYVMIPLFIGLRDNAVPIGMSDLLISLLDLERSYEDGNLLFLSLSPRGDETQAPEGRRALTVECLIGVEKWEQTFLIDYQEGVMKHLCHLFPFLEHEIEFVDFQWANDHVPRWSYPHFIYEATSDFHWREGILPPSLSKGIYLVGKENFPYLGLGGEIFSGLTVAQEILKKISK